MAMQLYGLGAAALAATRLPLTEAKFSLPNVFKKQEGFESIEPESFEISPHFERVHNEHNTTDISQIEELVEKILQNPGSKFSGYVNELTSIKDTFFRRLFPYKKTPLGEVLLELQNAQESPNRKLLSKETFEKANMEALKILGFYNIYSNNPSAVIGISDNYALIETDNGIRIVNFNDPKNPSNFVEISVKKYDDSMKIAILPDDSVSITTDSEEIIYKIDPKNPSNITEISKKKNDDPSQKKEEL